jgi:ATP-dependent helicase/nuclease subunit A
MSATSDSGRLPFDASDEASPDEEARLRAVDPDHHVVLEASAGTGKTHVLVDRYVNLLRRGVDPSNVLAITFTRKAAAEMRARILATLKERSTRSAEDLTLWTSVRDRSAEIAISTIDAFCLSLLHEFPLEADLDPGFEMADEIQVPRLLEEALDRTLDIGRSLAKTDEHVKLLFAELREQRIREGLGAMIGRRLVVDRALERALETGPGDLTPEHACAAAFARMRDVLEGLSGGIGGFLANGPSRVPRYALVAADLQQVANGAVPPEPGLVRSALDRVEDHFLVGRRKPRERFPGYSADDCPSKNAWKTHVDDVQRVAPAVAEVLSGFRRDVNAFLARGVRRLYRVALGQYYQILEFHGVIDFPEALARALMLLTQMDEFARSRYRLEARYHHVLVDEFQDTSRAQWALIALLVRSWGEGLGLGQSAPVPPTIFLVGDRKQSIYGFRDAEVAVMKEAATFVDGLSSDGGTRRAISRSFRAVPSLLGFINDVFDEVERNPDRRDGFEFSDHDRFPVPPVETDGEPAIGISAAPTVTECADRVGEEIRQLIERRQIIRDPVTKESRPLSASDVAILFRSRDSHREFEKALERRRIGAYVYKGLGFFDADEIQDVVALLRFLAAPQSDLRAAALMRSRLFRVSDPAIQTLAHGLAQALSGVAPPPVEKLDAEDRRALAKAREAVARWLDLLDRMPPVELLDLALAETAYLFETRGSRARQARENLKKIRSMIRRVQNRGYATMSRIADHVERLSAGDESNAVIDAGDAVSLMTVHAAKGLEFPVVFVVNLSRGTSGRRPAIRVGGTGDDGQTWLSIGEFQSEADEDAKERDREETKRLLYVALTRARDRLYLVSEVKNGRWRAGAGSLGEVLPATLRSTFEAAATVQWDDPDNVGSSGNRFVLWQGASGSAHQLKVCRPAPDVVRIPEDSRSIDRGPLDDFSGVADPLGLTRAAVTESLATTPSPHVSSAGRSRQALVGVLVHRLFERFGGAPRSDDEASDDLRQLLSDEERQNVNNLDGLIQTARRCYLDLVEHPELRKALKAGDAIFEVPFSVRLSDDRVVLRGSFDCLVRRSDRGITLLELKTGRPLPEHDAQLEIYLRAARALYPGADVEGHLIYGRANHETK